MSGAAPRRIGALVRSHHPRSTQALVLAAQLAKAGFHPVRIAADETRAPVDAGGFAKLSHSLESLAALGLKLPDRALWFCGDYAYYATVLGSAEADFWLLVEYDVALRDPASDYWRRLRQTLAGAGEADLLGGYLGPYRNRHFPHAYAEPWKAFFAVTGLSPRAIAHLYRARLREAAEGVPDPRGTHCEIFIASELQAAGGFRMLDLNTLLPGSIDRPGFGPFRAVPLGHEELMPGSGALVHRAVEMEEFLAKTPPLAARHGWVEEFLALLDQLRPFGVPPPAIEAATALARREQARHARRRARAAAEG